MDMLKQEDTILREKLAEVQHEIWTTWMVHLFTVSIPNDDGTYTIPVDKVERWKCQIVTPYTELSEQEKDGDREQADKIVNILGKNAY